MSALASLAARLGLGSRKLDLRRKLAAAVEAGDGPALTRLVERERASFAATRFGCRFTAHERWREAPSFGGVAIRRAPDGLGAKAAIVSFANGRPSYWLLVPGWQPPAARAQSIARLIIRIAHLHPLFEACAAGGPAGRFVLDLDDTATAEKTVVGLSGPPDRVFLIPDQVFVATEGYADLAHSYRARWVPFAERDDRVFWRGRPTGQLPPGGTWRDLPRARFVAECRRLAAAMPDVSFDVGLVKPDDAGPEWAEIEAAGLAAPFTPIETFVRQRVHVDIDGNSNSWPGLLSKLLLGGAILKVRSPYAQWYYDRLDGAVAWVAADLSDLGAAVGRLRTGEAARLAAGAEALAAAMTYAAEVERARPVIAAALAHWTPRL